MESSNSRDDWDPAEEQQEMVASFAMRMLVLDGRSMVVEDFDLITFASYGVPPIADRQICDSPHSLYP